MKAVDRDMRKKNLGEGQFQKEEGNCVTVDGNPRVQHKQILIDPPVRTSADLFKVELAAAVFGSLLTSGIIEVTGFGI